MSFSRSVTSLRLAFSEALTVTAVEEISARSSVTESALEVTLTVVPVRVAPSALMVFFALNVTASPLCSATDVARREPPALTVKSSVTFIFAWERVTSLPALTVRLFATRGVVVELALRSMSPCEVVMRTLPFSAEIVASDRFESILAVTVKSAPLEIVARLKFTEASFAAIATD